MSTQPHMSVDDQVQPKGLDLDAVRALVEPVARAHGLELFDVEWVDGRNGRVLRVTIERPQVDPSAASEPVTVDDCVRVSRDLSTVLDVEDLIGPAYTLEVSSPGLDRPLQKAADFQRHIGMLSKLKLNEPAPDGQHVLRGTIESVTPTSVRLCVDGREHDVAMTNIQRARLVFDVGTSKKKPTSKRTKGARRERRKR